MDIPKTFCVTLKSTPERTSLSRDYFKSVGLDVEFFFGIDGRDLNIEELGVYDKCGWRVRNGVVGCMLSHRLLWTCLQTMPYESILILEDDVVFVDGFRDKFDEYSSEIPDDWNIIYWGGGYYPNHSGVKEKMSDHVMKYKPTGTYAYMIKKNVLGKCLSYTDKSLIDIDVNMTGNLHNNLNVYIFNPVLANERSVNCGEYITDGPWRSLTFNWKDIK